MKVWNVYYEVYYELSDKYVGQKISFSSENGAYRFARAIRESKDYIIRNVIVKCEGGEVSKDKEEFLKIIKGLIDPVIEKMRSKIKDKEELADLIKRCEAAMRDGIKQEDVEQEIDQLEQWMNK